MELASVRGHFGPFIAERSTRAAVWLERTTLSAGPSVFPLFGHHGQPFGRFRIDGPHVQVDVVEDGFAALAAVRLAFHLAVVRRGGLMIHASGVAFADRAVLACGPSGAGKSTLARLLVEAGGRLLSDEILAVFPDGEVFGTPFRSDYEHPGSPDRAQLALILTLAHAPSERLDPISPVELMQTLASQAFRPEGGELSLPEVFARLASAVAPRPTARFSFRPVPQAAELIRSKLVVGPTVL